MKKNRPTVGVVIVTWNRKDKLKRALDSLPESSYRISEVVVVDNHSSDGTPRFVKKEFPKVKLVVNDTNTGAASGRNIGARQAKSDFIYFLDDDAFVERNTISSAVDTIKKDPNIAIAQSKVLSSFDKKKILGIAHNINTSTSLITAYGIGERDEGQYAKEMDIPMVGTGWLVNKKIFWEVGGFDENFFVPYEDSDISLRIRNEGYRIVFSPNSKIWHDDLKPTEINPRIRSIGIASPERARFVGRNKIYFMKKHSRGIGRLLFFFCLLPAFIVYHSIVIITSFRFDILKIYLGGVLEGLSMKTPDKNNKNKLSSFLEVPNNYFYKKLFSIYEYFSAIMDPITWLLRKDVKTVLDVGCGQGYPMKLLKMVRRDIQITGIDLFDDYIKAARKSGVFEKVIKGDVTKLRIKKDSYDAVICFQVIEHVTKKDGMQMLKVFENIAKKQVIITTPVEYFEHPDMDGNKLQRHLSVWSKREFQDLGYRVKTQSLNLLFGNDTGLVHRNLPKVVKGFLFVLDKLLSPIYLFVPGFADYWLIAIKEIK